QGEGRKDARRALSEAHPGDRLETSVSRRLRESVIASLATPLAHDALTAQLAAGTAEGHLDSPHSWLRHGGDLGDDLRYSRPRDQPSGELLIDVKSPVRGRVRFRPIYPDDIESENVADLIAEAEEAVELTVVVICLDSLTTAGAEGVRLCLQAAEG